MEICSLTTFSCDIVQRPTVEVTGHKAHGVVPEPGSVVIARVLPHSSDYLNSYPFFISLCSSYSFLTAIRKTITNAFKLTLLWQSS